VRVRVRVCVETALHFEWSVILSWVGVVCCVGLMFIVEDSLCGSVVEEGAKLLLTLSGGLCGGESVCSVNEFFRQG
jgi:hypothetical protein